MGKYPEVSLTFLLLVVGVPCHSAYTVDVYDSNTVQTANATYAENLRLVWNEDLFDRLTTEERKAAGDVKFNLSLEESLFGFRSRVNTRKITIPILSVKFFDELAIASAWLTRQGCAQDAVSDYVGILRYQGSSDRHGDRLSPPLEALSIPKNALDDTFTNDVSGKLLKSGVYFLMAHELGHVVYQHEPYTKITAAEAQAQEEQADAFALNIMRRISVPPMGMALYFMVASRYEDAPGDYKTLQEYENYLRRNSTHPLTSERLKAISTSIRDNANDFSRGQTDPSSWLPRIVKVATDIEAIGNTLGDRKIREYQRYRSLTMTVGDLRHTCP